MKTYINTLLIAAAVVFLGGCSDEFLNIPPEHYLSKATFYKTESDFTQAVTGVYEKTRGLVRTEGYVLGEMRSDNTHYILNTTDRGNQFTEREDVADFINNNQNRFSNEMYYACYSGISRANTILNQMKNKDFSEEFTTSTIGQTKFLRALFYFQLVRTFGEVPLYQDEVTDANNAFVPLSPVNTIYSFIIDDVEDAIVKLKDPTFPQSGRATRGSAKMLYAKILMTKPDRDYKEAKKQLEEIMKLGYKLEDNYSDVFETTNKNNKESLFEIQFMMGDNHGQQSDWLYSFIPRTVEASLITGVNGSSTLSTGGWNTPTQDLIESYDPTDQRLQFSIMVAAGHNNTEGNFVIDVVLPINDPAISNYRLSYPFINKYRHAHSKINNTNDNWPIFRYSDVLLSLAECNLVEGGDALTLVNEVRARAGLKALQKVDADIIALERRHEFAFENQRWYDLVRTGKAIEVMSAYGIKIKQLYPYLQARTYNITQEMLTFPIPYRETQINPDL